LNKQKNESCTSEACDFTPKEMNGVKVLITGGLGFIGSNLAQALVGLGADVTLYDALLREYGANWVNIEEIRNKVNVVVGDVRDYDKLKSLVAEANIIFHCASQVSRLLSMSNPELDIGINCIGTINVLEAARNSKNNEVKVIYPGSRASAGLAKKLPVDEETPVDPVDIYGVNKLASEMYLKIYHNTYGLKTTTLRLNNCYGPRAQMKTPNYGIAQWFIRMALEDKTLTVYHPGTMLRDYVYIDDVVKGLILVSQHNKAVGEMFYVGSEKPISIMDLAKKIVNIAHSGKIEMVSSPKEWSAIEIGDFYSSYAKIEKLGWKPETNIETGLKKAIEFYRERLQLYC
jgi:UDP-glucose 4-epimerase